MSSNFVMPKQIISGAGALNNAKDVFKKAGKKALIVSGKVMEKVGNVAKITVRLTFANPPAPSATISAVDVVPIFAPKTIDAACVKVISPLLTKPIAITVTAAELCTTAVVTVPMPTPISFLFDILANIRLISLPATISRLSPINFIP